MKKDALLNPELRIETVEIDRIGAVNLREMTAKDMADYLSKAGKVPDVELQCFLIARSIVDDDGERMYKDKDTEGLMRNPAAILTKLTEAILSLNGFQDDNEKN